MISAKTAWACITDSAFGNAVCRRDLFDAGEQRGQVRDRDRDVFGEHRSQRLAGGVGVAARGDELLPLGCVVRLEDLGRAVLLRHGAAQFDIAGARRAGRIALEDQERAGRPVEPARLVVLDCVDRRVIHEFDHRRAD